VVRRNTQDLVADCVKITTRDEQLLVLYLGKIGTHDRVEVLRLLLTEEGNVAEQVQAGTDLEGVHYTTTENEGRPRVGVSNVQFEVVAGRGS
jgi:hypothetical protein